MVYYPKEEIIYKTNARVKIALYYWILKSLQVMQSSLENDFPKVYIDVHSEKYIVSKLLVRVSGIEWLLQHKRMILYSN